jgi:hypothetical protein
VGRPKDKYRGCLIISTLTIQFEKYVLELEQRKGKNNMMSREGTREALKTLATTVPL